MSQPKESRPPANYLDPAIKAMVWVAGGLLTLSIVGEGMGAHSDNQSSAKFESKPARYYVTNPNSKKIDSTIHPVVNQAPSATLEPTVGVADYLVPLGVVTAEVVGLAYILNERRKRRHPFNQPFSPPEVEYYPFNVEETKAFDNIRLNYESES